MAAPMTTGDVELGFLENAEPFLLRSRFFPSKLGGRPAWLSLESLPTVKDLSCEICEKPTSFLVQVYAPDSNKTEAFHRTIYLFLCKNPECCLANSNGNLKVYRSQLPKDNKYYSSEPPAEVPVEKEPDAGDYTSICRVCGCHGPNSCSGCKKVNYCSKEHQVMDWKKGHKVACKGDGNVSTSSENFDCLFTEMEIVTEPENYVPEKETTEKSDEDKLKEYKEFLKTEKVSVDLANVSEAELQKMANEESENDKQLRRFKKRISHEPQQVLRYCKGGEPLWIAHSPKPESIPDCKCGAKRQFEFQILPHLLSYMDVDKLGASIDWGTLCVYTCSESCSIGNSYSREYLFKQDLV